MTGPDKVVRNQMSHSPHGYIHKIRDDLIQWYNTVNFQKKFFFFFFLSASNIYVDEFLNGPFSIFAI